MYSCHFRKGTKPCPRCFYPLYTTKQSLKPLRKKNSSIQGTGEDLMQLGKRNRKNKNKTKKTPHDPVSMRERQKKDWVQIIKYPLLLREGQDH